MLSITSSHFSKCYILPIVCVLRKTWHFWWLSNDEWITKPRYESVKMPSMLLSYQSQEVFCSRAFMVIPFFAKTLKVFFLLIIPVVVSTTRKNLHLEIEYSIQWKVMVTYSLKMIKVPQYVVMKPCITCFVHFVFWIKKCFQVHLIAIRSTK